MTETELYKELGDLTKEKDRWEESMPFWNRSDSNGPARTVADLFRFMMLSYRIRYRPMKG